MANMAWDAIPKQHWASLFYAASLVPGSCPGQGIQAVFHGNPIVQILGTGWVYAQNEIDTATLAPALLHMYRNNTSSFECVAISAAAGGSDAPPRGRSLREAPMLLQQCNLPRRHRLRCGVSAIAKRPWGLQHLWTGNGGRRLQRLRSRGDEATAVPDAETPPPLPRLPPPSLSQPLSALRISRMR